MNPIPVLTPASIMRRAAALAIDFLVFCLVFFPATYAVKGVWLMTPEDHLWIIFDPICAVFLAIIFLYFILLEAWFGRTIGKWLTGIRIVDMRGGRIGMRASLIRNFGRLIDGIPLYLTGILCIHLSAHKQRVGDMLAKTLVVLARPRREAV
jgi:uncharacterized RDD family membrane protein YckC